MKKEESDSSNVAVLGLILVSALIIFTIVYLKMNADDVSGQQITASELPVAIPDTTLTYEMVEEVNEEEKNDTLGAEKNYEKDTRTPIEAGEEDGYWDGWYDGAETGQRTRYDDQSSFASLRERELYAASYREGYEKGFSESVHQKVK